MGAALGRPPFLGAGRRGLGGRRPRRRPPAARTPTPTSSRRPATASSPPSSPAWSCSTRSSAWASSPRSTPATAWASTPPWSRRAPSPSTTASASSPSGARPCRRAADEQRRHHGRGPRPRRRQGRGGLRPRRRRRLGGQLQRAGPGRHRRRPRRHRRRRRRGQGARRQEGHGPAGERGVPHPVHGRRPATGCARPSPPTEIRDPDLPVDRQRRRRGPHRRPTTGPACSAAQLCSPVRWRQTLYTLDELGRHAPSSSSAPAPCSPAWSSARSPDASTLSVATPDQLDTLLETLHGHEGRARRASTRASTSSPPSGWSSARRPASSTPDPALDAGARARRPASCSAWSATTRSARPSPARSWACSPSTANGSPSSQPIAWLRIGMTCRRPDHRLGRRAARQDGHQRRPRGPLDTTDEWIRERTGHPRAPHRRHHLRAGHRGRAGPRSARAGLDRRRHRPGHAAPPPPPTSTCRPTAAVVAARARHRRRRLRPQRRLLGLRLRPRHRRRPGGRRHCERVLLIGAETMCRIIDWDDRNTAVLFGDGAGAVVLEAVDGPGMMLGWDLGSDGTGPAPALRRPRRLHRDGGQRGLPPGRAGRSTRRARSLERAGITAADIDLVVPHQANVRIIDAACQRLGIPVERDRQRPRPHRQHVGGSIPLALADAADAGRLHDGDLCCWSASAPA